MLIGVPYEIAEGATWADATARPALGATLPGAE